MTLPICVIAVMLAFLAGAWGCQEQGTMKPPEGRITQSDHPPRTPGVTTPLPPGRVPVPGDRDRGVPERAAPSPARDLRGKEAEALARGAIPPGRSFEKIYPPDGSPLPEKSPEELREEFRRGLEKSGLPSEIIEAEIEALEKQLFSPPASPQGQEFVGPDVSQERPRPDHDQLAKEVREGLEKAGLPPDIIEREAEGFAPAASPPPTPQLPPEPEAAAPSGESESVSAAPGPLRFDPEQFRQGLEKAGLPPDIIQREVEGFVPASPLPRPSQSWPGPESATRGGEAPPAPPARDPLKFDPEQFRQGLEKAGLPPDIVQREVEALRGNSGTPLQPIPHPRR